MTYSTQDFQTAHLVKGEMVIPGEKQNISSECTLRHFLLQVQRNYSASALNAVDGFNVRTNRSVDDIFGDDFPDTVSIEVALKPQGTLEDFVAQQGDAFFETLQSVASRSDVRGMRGSRGVFITEFVRDAQNTDVLKGTLVLSTTVFFNDFRATLGYPYLQDELDTVVERIYTQLSASFPSIQFELSGEMEEDLAAA